MLKWMECIRTVAVAVAVGHTMDGLVKINTATTPTLSSLKYKRMFTLPFLVCVGSLYVLESRT